MAFIFLVTSTKKPPCASVVFYKGGEFMKKFFSITDFFSSDAYIISAICELLMSLP